jgi:hypothetical protein
LLYSAFTPPVLFTLGAALSIARLLDEFSSERAIYPHIRPEIVPVLAERYRIIEQKLMWRMVPEPARFHSGPTDTVRLRAADLGRLQNLYADGQSAGESPDFFTPSMLEGASFAAPPKETNWWQPLARAWVVPEEGVAAIGCVYTCRVRRGSGLASTHHERRYGRTAEVEDRLHRAECASAEPGCHPGLQAPGIHPLLRIPGGAGPTEPLIPAFP